MIIYNQNDYGGVAYPSPTIRNATVKSGGCGVVCASIIVENLTGKSFPPDVAAKYAIKVGARVAGGTDMVRLAENLCRDFDIGDYYGFGNVDVLVDFLKKGWWAIANTDGNEGTQGVFSSDGHFVVLCGIDGATVKIIDPAWTETRYKGVYRRNLVTETDTPGLILSNVHTLHGDTVNRYPRYWVFRESEDREMTGEEIYKRLCEYLDSMTADQLNEATRQEYLEAVNEGITDGKRPFGLALRYQSALMAKRAKK